MSLGGSAAALAHLVRRPWILAAVLVGGLAVVGGALWVGLSPPSLGYDLVILHQAAERLAGGLPLYLDETGARFTPGSVELFYGPPSLAIAATPLLLLDEATTRLVAFPAGMAIVGLAMVACGHPVRGRLTPDARAALSCGTLLSFAVLWGATLGAASVFTLALLAFGWWALERDRTGVLAGLCLGTAIALRLYPVVVLAALVVGRRWRALAASVVVVGGWTIVGVLIAGPEQTAVFVELLRRLSQLDPPPGSISPAAAALSAGAPSAWVRGVQIVSVSVGLVVVLVGGLRLRGGSAADAPRRLVGWGGVLGGMLIVSPVVWDHYLTALLPLAIGLVAVAGRPLLGLLPVVLLPGWLGAVSLAVVPPTSLLPIRLLRVRASGSHDDPSGSSAGQSGRSVDTSGPAPSAEPSNPASSPEPTRAVQRSGWS